MNDIQELVLFCLCEKTSAEVASRLEELPAGDWKQFLKTATGLGVAPILSSRLHPLGVSIPFVQQSALQLGLINNTGRNLNIFPVFRELAEVLALKNIPFIALKGVYLAEKKSMKTLARA